MGRGHAEGDPQTHAAKFLEPYHRDCDPGGAGDDPRETALSFLGIGLRPPVVSWGVLMFQAQNPLVIELTPWQMLPGLFVVLTVMAFISSATACGTPPIRTARPARSSRF